MNGSGASGRRRGLAFSIAAWRAWAPGVRDPADWDRWLAVGGSASDDAPDVSFLPPRLRQRLGGVGRMALATAWPCSEGLGEFAYVYGSRMSTLARTVGLLESIVRRETLSPAYFSLSVHNAVPGLFAIARGNRGPATAISAGLDTLAASLVEAITTASTSARPVVMTYVEGSPPPVYAPLVPASPYRPFSVSLRIAAGGADFRLHLGQTAGAAAPAAQEAAIMALLTGRSNQVAFGAAQRCALERIHG